jgi:hypothetical protein
MLRSQIVWFHRNQLMCLERFQAPVVWDIQLDSWTRRLMRNRLETPIPAELCRTCESVGLVKLFVSHQHLEFLYWLMAETTVREIF